MAGTKEFFEVDYQDTGCKIEYCKYDTEERGSYAVARLLCRDKTIDTRMLTIQDFYRYSKNNNKEIKKITLL